MLVTAFVAERRRRSPRPCSCRAGDAAALASLALGAPGGDIDHPDYNAPHLLSPEFLFDRVDRLTYAIGQMLKGPFSGPLGHEPRTIAIVLLAMAVIVATMLRAPAIAAAVAVWLTLSFLALASIYWTSRVDIHFYVGDLGDTGRNHAHRCCSSADPTSSRTRTPTRTAVAGPAIAQTPDDPANTPLDGLDVLDQTPY